MFSMYFLGLACMIVHICGVLLTPMEFMLKQIIVLTSNIQRIYYCRSTTLFYEFSYGS